MPRRGTTNNPNGRPRTSPDGEARTHYATVRASPEEAAEMDRRRGAVPRGRFLRDAALRREEG